MDTSICNLGTWNRTSSVLLDLYVSVFQQKIWKFSDKTHQVPL